MRLSRSIREGNVGSAAQSTYPLPAVSERGGSRLRIAHIITGLSQGGAEANLFKLINATRQSWDVVVISLADEGYYGQRLRALGIRVFCCRMNERGQALAGFRRLLRLLRKTRPAVVQTWMYHADLLGGLAARLVGCRSVVWGIRNLHFDSGRASWSARAASRLSAWCSSMIPAAIVSCSQAAAQEHARRGYARGKMRVIPNGYDCVRLNIAKVAGKHLRTQWGIGAEDFLIGMVARWDPLKDHGTLLAALGALRRADARVRGVLIGAGMNGGNAALLELLRTNGLQGQVVLAGPQEDITAVMNALDLHVLSSRSESFPNVVAEAMACGTPCVVTAVGDAMLIVGEQGWCVPPADRVALEQAMKAAVSVLRGAAADELRVSCRRRITERYSEERMVGAFEEVWRSALGARAHGR